ncbi:hypothetical protein L2755_21870 [Shewanella abyssi]|uniref:hypothetical protein n=1 Tax=Shewanella abyssi TaxID=311789 RepID=UPI00200D8F62|nr:hypothetical protein [Shewanella abyssi]MCL1052237.1 hypothetical protein [Shewanella abyssi]
MNLLKVSIFVSLTGICVFALVVNTDVNSDDVINGKSFETALPPPLVASESTINPNNASKLEANTVPGSNDSQPFVRELPVFDSSEQKKSYYKRARDIQDALNEGDWKRFLELNTRIFEISPDLMSLAILQAITANAPLSVIEELIFAGGEIPEQAILVLAIKRNYELASSLTPYGLDLYYVDDQQRNAYYFAAMGSSDNPEFLFFLARNNVSFVYPEDGDDALSLLIKAPSINAKSESIATIIKLGHRITNIHLQLMNDLKNRDDKTYKYLVNSVSGLEVQLVSLSQPFN